MLRIVCSCVRPGQHDLKMIWLMPVTSWSVISLARTSSGEPNSRARSSTKSIVSSLPRRASSSAESLSSGSRKMRAPRQLRN